MDTKFDVVNLYTSIMDTLYCMCKCFVVYANKELNRLWKEELFRVLTTVIIFFV